SSTGVIKNLTSPRYFVGISSSKGYISDWGSGTTGGNIKVVDLTSNTITKTIAAGKYPDKMILSGTKLFVINSAGLDKDSTITIIDTQTDTPLKTLVIGGDPTGIVTDSNGKIWVLCSGIEDYAAESNSTPGKIVRINPNDYSIEYSYTFPDNTKHPTELCTNSAKKRLFYIYGSGVSYYDITTSEIVPFITPANGYIYGLGYDPKTDYIYLTDPKDFNSNGTVYRYNSTTGALKDNFQVGINPQEITFN
ncbi:MAG: DUF5074 domain-containing protein, partial [Bacteroidota bacterium]|nr:DUF5074 domain-containing protein [Bacteroidota bacterium]